MENIGSVHPLVILFAVAYFAVIFGIGWFTRKAAASPMEYTVAGRSVGSFINGAGLAASFLSPASFLGLPAFIFLLGYPFWWALAGIIMGMPLAALLTAGPLRKYAPVSFTDYYADRYESEKWGRAVTSFPVIITGILYITLSLVGTALFMMAILQIPYFWSLVIGTAAVLFYVYMGGMVATTWATGLQGIIMTIAAVVVAIIIIANFGGFGGLAEAIENNNPKFWLPPQSTEGAAHPIMSIWTGMVSFFFVWHYGFSTMPYSVVKFFTAMDINSARLATFWSAFFGGLMYMGLIVIGSAARVVLEQLHPAMQAEGVDSAVGVLGYLQEYYATGAAAITDYSMIATTQALGQPWLLGVLCAGGLAICMSTVSAWTVVMQVVLGRDWMIKILGSKWAQDNQVKAMQMWLVIILVLCFLLAIRPPGMVLDLSGWAFVMIVASCGPGLILGVWWDKATTTAHISTSLIFTVLTVVSWLYANIVLGSPHWFFLGEQIFGFKVPTGHQVYWVPLAFIFFIVVSLLSKQNSPETVRKYSTELRYD
ncbi:MAG: sodium:solute symporter family protein [Desulfohalobiaceae bacterium]